MNSTSHILVVKEGVELPDHISNFLKKNNIKLRSLESSDLFFIDYIDNKVCLNKSDEIKMKPIISDFLSEKNNYRRKHGGGFSEAVAKAVGLKKGKRPNVLDATAGLGKDAFVLATLGCHVTLVERNVYVALLLCDALYRASLNDEIGEWVKTRMKLIFTDSKKLNLQVMPQVVYCDPMYPDRKNPASVKKEMQMFKELIGSDEDSQDLFNWGMSIAQEKVVVKRMLNAPQICDRAVNNVYKTKKHRFDIYLTA